MQENNDKLHNALIENKFTIGRMIAFSKSRYRDTYPNNLVVFNSNILSENGSKVWFGDLDITLDKEKLQEVADKTGVTFYVLYETDARFGAENKPFEELKRKAVAVFKPQ